MHRDFRDLHLHIVNSSGASGVRRSDVAIQTLKNTIYQRATSLKMRIGRGVRKETSYIVGRKASDRLRL